MRCSSSGARCSGERLTRSGARPEGEFADRGRSCGTNARLCRRSDYQGRRRSRTEAVRNPTSPSTIRSRIAAPRASRPSLGDETALCTSTARTSLARWAKDSAPSTRPARRKTDGGGGVGELCRAAGRCVVRAGAAAWWRVGVAAGWAGDGEEDAVCGCEVEATWVTTVAAGFGAACGAGSGAGPRTCGGAGSGPSATAGAAKVATRATHAPRTSARRPPIRSKLYDPRSSTFPPQAVKAMLAYPGSLCQTQRLFGSQPQRPPHAASQPRAPEPNGEEAEIREAEQHPELEHRSGVLDRRVRGRRHAHRANGASGFRCY